MRNTLFYGDNMEIMRQSIADESVDLIYLDPPFNSARDYNVLFKQAKKDENRAQIMAFTDTWQWSKRRHEEFRNDPRNARLFELMESLYGILGQSEMMAYLLMMAPRLLEMHRTLRPAGSLYLHCDPVASHCLKMLLDAVFGPQGFRNEIIWKRTHAHGGARRWGPVHDVILFYAKSATYTWNKVFQDYSESYANDFYRSTDEKGTYQLVSLTGAGITQAGDSGKPWHGVDPTSVGRHWAVPSRSLLGIATRSEIRSMSTQEKLDLLDAHGLICWPEKGATPRYKRYLDENPGNPIQDVISDIHPIAAHSQERIGYPTQKPLALLERVINASSNPGDVVFDPFCGCGTAVVAAEKLGRRWIGIDITFIAIDLMIDRLAKSFELKRGADYDVLGDPYDAHSAGKLFLQSPKEFEMWAVRKIGGVPQPGKSSDKGVDGKVYFQDQSEKLQFAVCQVKGGHLNPSAVRDFGHVAQRDKAAMGFFICLETPSKGMYREAEELGFFESPSGRAIPRLQIRTIKELIDGKEFDYPKGYSLKSGGKRLAREGEQAELGLD